MLEAQRLRGNRIIGAAGPAPGGRSLSTFRIIGSFANRANARGRATR